VTQGPTQEPPQAVGAVFYAPVERDLPSRSASALLLLDCVLVQRR